MQSIKVVIVGDGAVGKTCFYLTYVNNNFPGGDYLPTVLDEYSTNVMIDQRPVTVGLWDTAGQTDYDRLRPLSYPQTDVFIVAYAVSNQDSFENVTKKWIPEITQHSAAPFILLATKADHREDDTILKALAARGKSCVSTEQGRQVAEENGAMGFFEVSAKNLTGLQEAMDRVIRTGLSMVLGDIEPKLPPKPQPPAVTNGPELCDDLELLVNEKQTHDVVFRVGDREIYGHKIVLSSACEALERLILDGVAVSEFFTAKMIDHVCLIEVSNRVTDETLLIFLTCIYSGKQSESASTGVKYLANACGLDITLDRHIGLQKKIAVNMDKMWDFEIVADDKTRFRASKALLWCRSGYFKSLFEDANVKHVDVDMSSSLVAGVLEYVVSGTVSHHQIEELLKVSTKWEMPGLLSTCEYILVQDVITLKNVFKWSAIAFQDMLYPKLRDYCIWLMRINYHVIKDKKEFQELPGGEVGSVMGGAWPGEHYKEMRAKWKQKHGKRKLVPSRQEVTLSRIVDQTGDAGDAVITLPEDLVLAPQDQIVHKIDPSLKISSYTRLAEWKKIKSSAVPFPACYDAVLFTDQTTLFVLAGSTEKGTKSVKQYFGYDFEHKNWYVIDLEEALPAVTLGVRVGDNIYFLSTKNTMLTYNTESHKFVTTPLPFVNARELLCAHHVNGEIYVLHAAGDTNDFNSAAVYNIASQEWITKTFGGVKPPERSGFATAVVGDHIYMYAGFRQAGYNADLWRLDTVTLEWHKVETTGNPVGCAGHSLNSMYINGQLYLVAFGGYNGHYLNSAQFLNLNTLEWEVFTCQPINTDTTIGPRTGATAIVINNNLYVVGGYNGPYYNDAYVLKPRALSLKLMCFEYLHRNAKNFTDLSEKLPSDVYEEYRHFV